jgi:hypothetical protein
MTEKRARKDNSPCVIARSLSDVAISVPSHVILREPFAFVILRERLRINSATEESRWWEEIP